VQPSSHQQMEIPGKDIQHFQQTISDHSSYDFSDYSHTSLRRRLTRILLELETDMDGLTRRMRVDPFFLDGIVRKLTVHTTELFRDPEIWLKMKHELIPLYLDKPTLRVWHPGCSTGQEVYSMAMLLDALGVLDKSELYGTDINPDVIDTAKTGTYKYRFNQSYLENFSRVILENTGPSASGSSTSGSSAISSSVPALSASGRSVSGNKKSWKKYFRIDEANDQIRMTEYVRSKPVFRKMDLVMDPNPFPVKFDLIICRNVIIYFNNELQNRVFDLFYQNMNNYGALVLGIHETILGPFTKKFMKRGDFYLKGGS